MTFYFDFYHNAEPVGVLTEASECFKDNTCFRSKFNLATFCRNPLNWIKLQETLFPQKNTSQHVTPRFGGFCLFIYVYASVFLPSVIIGNIQTISLHSTNIQLRELFRVEWTLLSPSVTSKWCGIFQPLRTRNEVNSSFTIYYF